MRVWALALNTAREAVRNKILYSILFFAVFVVGAAALFGAVSIGDRMKFVKDFALMAVSLFGVVMAIVLGVNLLQKELGRRTIYNVLAKPVRRGEFLLGKFLGLAGTVGAVVAVMTGALAGVLALVEGRLDAGILWAGSTAVLEVVVVAAVAMLFSAMVVTPSLAGLFTAAAFIAGRSAGYLQYFIDRTSGAARELFRGLYWVLPHLDRFNIADQVVYGHRLDPGYYAALVVYAACYVALVLAAGVALFARREFA